LERVAETIWDPESKARSATPDIPLAEQFERFSKQNPDWMWYTDGVRVFTDEHGGRVVVGLRALRQLTKLGPDCMPWAQYNALWARRSSLMRPKRGALSNEN
jgi:hypothetical protein